MELLTVLSGGVQAEQMTGNLHTGTVGHKLGSESAPNQLRRIVDEGHGELCGGERERGVRSK